jgi:exopolysaccharide biosynthesis polyprenyl glycosylphosphotransferase
MAERTPALYDGAPLPARSALPALEQPPERHAELPLPLVLQSSASSTVNRHVARAAIRVSTLLFADALVLAVLRLAFHAIRDRALFGSTLASAAAHLIRVGTLPPVELLTAMIIGLAVFGNYGVGDRRREPRRIFAGCALSVSLIAWAQLWDHWSVSALAGFALIVVCFGVALTIARFLIESVVGVVRPESSHAARTLVIGRSADTARIAEYRGLVDRADFTVVAMIDTVDAATLGRYVSRERIETVVMMGTLDPNVAAALVRTADAAGCQVLRVTETPPEFEPQLVWRRGTPLLQLTRPGLRGQQLLLKRTFDIFGAALLLVLCAPLMGVIALAIRCSSSGPVLFRQIRVGRGGRRFHIHKFRTMVTGAETLRDDIEKRSVYSDPRLFKVQNDPRVTRIGRTLRRTSMDELPQLWDVLCGRMSLVGPRPPLPSEVALYEDAHYLRFEMKPGMTGPWQVSGRNRVTDFEAVLGLEGDYMRDWSIWKDFAILGRTVPAVLRMDGAH